jgi:hypothetical protein
MRHSLLRRLLVASFLGVGLVALWLAAGAQTSEVADAAAFAPAGPSPAERLQAEHSAGCVSCHVGIEPMHASPAVKLGCTDCHGGDAASGVAEGTASGGVDYDQAKSAAHVTPRFPDRWRGRDGRSVSANPERTYTLLNEESPDFVRFVNPGDLRAAPLACGPCHAKQVNSVPKSTMATASVFWAAAAYANGILPSKHALFGESYGVDGRAQKIVPGYVADDPLADYRATHAALPFLLPLPNWQIIQPGEYFRAFEPGGILQPSSFPEIGNPNLGDEAGKPDIRFSNRGRGTGLRVSPAVLNIQKTRLNDPHLSFLGTNDHPGDFRSSGCTACHVVYANDREPAHSGPWAKYGHLGQSATDDPTIPRLESGHPIRHRLTRAVPTSQCMSCHMHQPNSFLNTYLGYTMWDYVSDAPALWPKEQRAPTPAAKIASLEHNPEGAAVKGLWTDLDFLAKVSELNPTLEQTQFADYHGHGWIFQAVFKRDRHGNLLDAAGGQVAFDDPDRFRKAVHLKDIHLEKGMHCVDCHFSQDEHGDGLLHGEYGDTIEIGCQDCHGSVNAYSRLRTTGPAAPPGGTDLALATTPFGQQRFVWRNGKLLQRSMLEEGREWEVVQVKDSVTPGNPRYNLKSARAKTLLRDGTTWGDGGADPSRLAHADNRITCYTCHSSWITSCFGCHLPQEANLKSKMLHYEGETTRNLASYNPQVIRTDVFMLGINGTSKGNMVAPVRSSSALVLSSINGNRQRVYIQQPPISAPGYSSQAFNPHVPHTVRTVETKGCSDCHVAASNDNNAWMAQTLLQGTGFVNFVGRYAWAGLGKEGVEAVAVSEFDEPQAVYGSYLHRLAYPDDYRRLAAKGGELAESHHHHASGDLRSLQLRGEFLYTAQGKAGLVVYDVANIDNKDFSERIVSAPVSPLGQRTYVRTRDAAAVALPTNMPVAPWRQTAVGDPANEETPLHPIYHYAFVADRQEGLVMVNVDTLTDGDPLNNFLAREPINGEASYNPDGLLVGARNLTVAGNLVYVVCDRGLVILDLGGVHAPTGRGQRGKVTSSARDEVKVVAVVDGFRVATAVAVQFRYAFVTDASGLTVVEVTNPAAPRVAARVAIEEARNVYLARTYAYVAGGRHGLVIVDVERPEQPRIDQTFTADGVLDDVWDVKVGATYAGLYAYVANGERGLGVLELTSPDTAPGYAGFSPRPAPHLIATRHTEGPAYALSRGLDRDRAADESGNQVSIFNRIGARPFNLEEMQRLYLRDAALYTVTDEAEHAH